MITDYTNGKLDQIRAFAKENGLEAQFEQDFSRFSLYEQNGYDVELYPDFAPHSLEFALFRNGHRSLYGGFIFHSPADGFGNGGSPTFSVSLDDSPKTRWQIHT